jgi:hypothetical protein
MEHAQARPLVSDWARGRLDAARARDVETHVRICQACKEAADVAAGLDAEGHRLAGTETAHPSPDALARYVETPEEESIAALARIGAHVRGCDDCREDVTLMREAAAPAWWRSVRSWLAAPSAPARLLQPALAVAAVLLAYPAWVGLVEYPRARAAAERRIHDAEARAQAEAAARALPVPPTAPRGGGVAALVLRGAARGGDAIPALRVREGQTLQPVLVDAVLPAGPVAIALVREPDTRAWTIDGLREDFWDPANALVGLLVPTEVLTPGDYRLELREAPGRPPFVTARFRVLPPR